MNLEQAEPGPNPNSPLAVAENLIDRYLDEEISEEDFLRGLEVFAEHVDAWYQNLTQMTPPEEEASVLLEGSLQGIDKIGQGIDLLRGFREDPRDSLFEEALTLIEEGQGLLVQVKEITDQNITSAVDDARYID